MRPQIKPMADFFAAVVKNKEPVWRTFRVSAPNFSQSEGTGRQYSVCALHAELLGFDWLELFPADNPLDNEHWPASHPDGPNVV